MGLSTERKIFLGLGTIAIAALIIEQGVLRPGEAGASILLEEPGSELPIESEVVINELSIPAAQILMDRLGSENEQAITEDLGFAFTMQSQNEPGITPDQSGDENSTPSSNQSEFALLGTRAIDLPVLSAVMPTSDGGAAVIDGVVVRVDQETLSGFRLIEVLRRSIVLERNETRYVINIPLSE